MQKPFEPQVKSLHVCSKKKTIAEREIVKNIHNLVKDEEIVVDGK